MSETIVRDKIYIDGAWVTSEGSGLIDVIDSNTEEVFAQIPDGAPADVEKAVTAARNAFESWSQTSVEDRAKYLQAIHEGIQARSDEIATAVAKECGMPLTLSQIVQAGLPASNWALFSNIVADYDFTEQIGNSEVVKEPVGVVGCITPWNYPLHQVTLKVAPAFAAGCTVVLKPSEVAPVSAFILAEVIDDVGLPPGVFNLVSGTGPIVGEALATSPQVDMISFTGSTRAGKRVSEVASATVKRVALELGGKSPSVILDDADFAAAVAGTVQGCYLNSGQTCTALTRMLVPKSRLAEAEEIAKQTAEAFKPGSSFDAETRLGPLANKNQHDRVRDFIKPTVFSDVRNDMTIAREEIFGPVLSIIPYDDEDDAVSIANDTIYGLAAAVWSQDSDKAKSVARKIRAGQIQINAGGFNPMAPFGGFKQSGKGREAGKYGLEEYLEIKSLQL